MRIHNRTDKNDEIFQKWNATTASCFYHKMQCHKCPNEWACKMNDDKYNIYRIAQVKYATLMTYTNLGKKGLHRFIDIKEEE